LRLVRAMGGLVATCRVGPGGVGKCESGDGEGRVEASRVGASSRVAVGLGIGRGTVVELVVERKPGARVPGCMGRSSSRVASASQAQTRCADEGDRKA
jgi:hypothetical protein